MPRCRNDELKSYARKSLNHTHACNDGRTTKEDSIAGIYDTLKSCAQISQAAGGIGLAIQDIRAKGSYIKGANRYSEGIIPMLRVFNDTARYVDQGGGKRKGSFTIYLEPWHADVFDFLDLKNFQNRNQTTLIDSLRN